MAHAIKDFLLKLLAIIAAGFAAHFACRAAARLIMPQSGQTADGIQAVAKSQSQIKATLGRGGLLAVLGGYRTLISDIVWIKSYLEWEKRDTSACMASIELAATLDPSVKTYWVQGALIIAYDVPHWRLESLPKSARTPQELAVLRRRYGKVALSFLERALDVFPDDFWIILRMGQIAVGMDDFPLAQKYYAQIAEPANAPVFAMRTYAAILEKNGEFSEALGFLERVDSQLDADSPLKKVVPLQIASLKKRLKLSSQNTATKGTPLSSGTE